MKKLIKRRKILFSILFLLILISCLVAYFFLFNDVIKTIGVFILLFSYFVSFILLWYFFQELTYQFSSGEAQGAFKELFFGLRPRSVAITFGFSLFLILCLPIVLTRPAIFDSLGFSYTGQIGDTFGGIMGPFIAILAAWLTYKAFLMQYEANQKIKRDSDISRFETNFFQLLTLQQKITEDLILYTEVVDDNNNINGLSLPLKHVMLRGREAIRQIYDKGKTENKLKLGNLYISYGGVLSNIENQGYNYMAQNEDLSFLDNYFRHMYRIIKYVDDAKPLFTLDRRYNYVCLLRAQLSDYELGLVFYNCLSDNGKEKFKPLAEKYALFNNIRDKVLQNPEEDKRQFADGAFEFKSDKSES